MLKGNKVKKKQNIGHKVGYLVTELRKFARCEFAIMLLLRVKSPAKDVFTSNTTKFVILSLLDSNGNWKDVKDAFRIFLYFW